MELSRSQVLELVSAACVFAEEKVKSNNEQQFEKKIGKHGGSWSSQRTEHQSESYMCKKVWFDYK